MTNLDSWVLETIIKGLMLLFRNDASTQIWVRMIEWNLASPWAFLVAQLVKNPPAMRETPVWFLDREDPLEKDRLLTPVLLGFPGGSDGKESACNAGDLDSILGLGWSPGGGHGNPLQYSCLENPHGQRSLASCNPWGCKELDRTKWLSTAQHWNANHNTWMCICVSSRMSFQHRKYTIEVMSALKEGKIWNGPFDRRQKDGIKEAKFINLTEKILLILLICD